MGFKNLNELEMYLQDKTGTTKLLVEEIRKRDSKIAEMQTTIDNLTATILMKGSDN